MPYTIHTGPEHTGVTAATLREVEEYWMSRIRQLEDDQRAGDKLLSERVHRLERDLAAMKTRWPGGWEAA